MPKQWSGTNGVRRASVNKAAESGQWIITVSSGGFGWSYRTGNFEAAKRVAKKFLRDGIYPKDNNNYVMTSGGRTLGYYRGGGPLQGP